MMTTLNQRLLTEFTHQFIASCLAVWLLELASVKSTNTFLADYILKIIKESFHEVESSIMLANLFDCQQTTRTTENWPESMYLIVSSLIERVGNLAYDVLKSLLGRMLNDSKALAKSSVFSRCILLVLNKMKANNKTSEGVTSSQTAIKSTLRGVDADLVFIIESIVDNNLTLMKKSLQIAFKFLKS